MKLLKSMREEITKRRRSRSARNSLMNNEIPFTQYLRPDGRKRPVSIEVPTKIAQLAFNFIESGGWFEVEELTSGHVSLTACYIVDGEPDDIAIRVVENGPPVVKAVEELVREAAIWTPPCDPAG